jgi:hypothetical protein
MRSSRSCLEPQVTEAGFDAIAGVVGIGGESNARDERHRIAEGGTKIGGDIANDLPPLPGSARSRNRRRSSAGDRYRHSIPTRRRLRRTPDVAQRRCRQIGAMQDARRSDLHAVADAKPLGWQIEQHINARRSHRHRPCAAGPIPLRPGNSPAPPEQVAWPPGSIAFRERQAGRRAVGQHPQDRPASRQPAGRNGSPLDRGQRLMQSTPPAAGYPAARQKTWQLDPRNASTLGAGNGRRQTG